MTEVQKIIRQTTEQMEPFAADNRDFFNLPGRADGSLREAAKRSAATKAPAEFCGLEGFNASNSRLVIVSLREITQELTLLVGEETSRTCNVHIVDEANVEALLGLCSAQVCILCFDCQKSYVMFACQFRVNC